MTARTHDTDTTTQADRLDPESPALRILLCLCRCRAYSPARAMRIDDIAREASVDASCIDVHLRMLATSGFAVLPVNEPTLSRAFTAYYVEQHAEAVAATAKGLLAMSMTLHAQSEFLTAAAAGMEAGIAAWETGRFPIAG